MKTKRIQFRTYDRTVISMQFGSEMFWFFICAHLVKQLHRPYDVCPFDRSQRTRIKRRPFRLLLFLKIPFQMCGHDKLPEPNRYGPSDRRFPIQWMVLATCTFDAKRQLNVLELSHRRCYRAVRTGNKFYRLKNANDSPTRTSKPVRMLFGSVLFWSLARDVHDGRPT